MIFIELQKPHRGDTNIAVGETHGKKNKNRFGDIFSKNDDKTNRQSNENTRRI